VSKTTIALSDFTVIIWFSLMGYHVLKALPVPLSISSNCLTILAVTLSVIFVITMGFSSDARKS
jgi:hypothetical protein